MGPFLVARQRCGAEAPQVGDLYLDMSGSGRAPLSRIYVPQLRLDGVACGCVWGFVYISYVTGHMAASLTAAAAAAAAAALTGQTMPAGSLTIPEPSAYDLT